MVSLPVLSIVVRTNTTVLQPVILLLYYQSSDRSTMVLYSQSGFGKILPFTIWPLGNRSGGYTGKVKWKGTYTGHVNIRMVVYLSKFKRFIGIPVTWRSRSILPDTAFGLRWYTGILLWCRYIPNTDTYSADWRRDDITGEYCATSTRLPSVGSTTNP